MPTYVSLVRWTAEGIRNYRDSPERSRNFTAQVERSGGRVRELLYTVGDYDLVVITEFPDDESSVAVLLQVGALGFVRTSTMRAFTGDEITEVISRTG